MTEDRPETSRPLGEISQAPAPFEQFLDRNQKNLLILAILLVLGGAAFVVWRGIAEGKERAAGQALVEAEELAALREVVEDHAGTAAAGSAEVLLADQLWQDGQQDDAIRTLRNFLEQKPEHPARHTARASLGAKLIAQGEPDQAESVLNDLLQDPYGDFLAPYALILLGDISRGQNDAERAKEFYERARTEHPGRGFDQLAAGRITLLEAELPTEIDPPPAPETPETTGEPMITPPPFLAAPEEAQAPAADPPAAEATETPAPEATETPAPEGTETPAPEGTETPAPEGTETPEP